MRNNNGIPYMGPIRPARRHLPYSANTIIISVRDGLCMITDPVDNMASACVSDYDQTVPRLVERRKYV